MDKFYNGMPAGQAPNVTWRRSTYSSQNGNCVEVAQLPTGEFAMRNSRDPEGSALVYTRDELAAFVAGVKDGEFDLGIPDAARAAGADARETTPGRALERVVPQTEAMRPEPLHEKVGEELESLTERIGAGDRTLDRAATEQVLRVLGAVVSLHDTHQVDERGNCSRCRANPRPWRRPWWVQNACSVHSTLSLYLGHSGSAAAS